MTTSSAKAKGRRAQQWLRDRILWLINDITYEGFDLNDVRSTPMGVSGEDIQISSNARKSFPFSCEVKNQEKIGFWPTVRQATANASGHIPLIMFKKNRTKPWVALPAEDFFAIMYAFGMNVDEGLLPEEIEYAKKELHKDLTKSTTV